jgi:aminoglycoside phosphotransferase (APT) family kinase protein
MERDAVGELRTRSSVPASSAVQHALSRILAGGDPEGVSLVNREPHAHASTFPSEVITCRIPGGRTLKLFCKYVTRDVETVGERQIEPLYEARVYEQLLEGLPLPTAKLYGSWTEGPPGEAWLVFEYLEGSARLALVDDPEAALEEAAAWIGSFHARIEGRARPEARSGSFLRRFDRAHYESRLQRMRRATRAVISEHAWLESLAHRFDQVIAHLLEAPQTVIHGEYYPNNILCRSGELVPIDWETAAIAPGELDLAALTERWPEPVAARCRRRYLEARGRPAGEDFELALTAARMYANVYWLGYPREASGKKWSLSQRGGWRLDQLRVDGEALGLL